MADFGGFQVTTPQEVLAGLNAQRQQIAALPASQRRVANAQFQFQNIFGNQELEKARTIERSMKAANRVFQASTNEQPGSLDHEAGRLSIMYDAVKDLDPMAASQIQTRLTTIREAQFEQDRLNRQSARGERNTAVQERQIALQEAKFGRETDFDGWQFAIKELPNGEVHSEAFNMEDPARNQAFAQAIQDGAIPATQRQAADAMGRRNAVAAMRAEFNNSAHKTKVNQYTADIDYAKRATSLIKLFRDNPDTGTIVNDITRGAHHLVAEGRAAVNVMRGRDGSVFDLGATQDLITESLNAIEDFTLPEGIDRARFEAAILNMGYVLARSLDSGGRLSDQDVNMAIRMLTGGSTFFEDGTISVPASQITAILLDRAREKAEMVTDPMSPDNVIFTEEKAALEGIGGQQSRTIRGLMTSYDHHYRGLVDAASQVLSEDELTRVLDPDNARPRSEVRADRAVAVERGQRSQELTNIRKEIEQLERVLEEGRGRTRSSRSTDAIRNKINKLRDQETQLLFDQGNRLDPQ